MNGSNRRLLVFAPGGRGGAQRRADLISETLADRGWQVYMVVRESEASRFEMRRGPNLVCLSVPGFGSGRSAVALYLLVSVLVGVRWARPARCALAIQLPWPAAAAALVGRLYGIPFMLFSTLSGELSDVDDIRIGRSSAVRLRLLRRAAWLVAQTDAGAQEAARALPTVPTAVVPNPVNGFWTELLGTPTASFVGRLSEQKDIPTLLEAWCSVVEHRPDARLVIAGDGGTSRSVEAEIRSAVNDDARLRSTVTMLGWVDDVQRVLRSCDLFIFPSRSEGMSNALLEAMATGRVIVASDIAANRAVVGDSYPFLFPVGHPSALAIVVQQAMADEDLRGGARRQLRARLDQFAPHRVAASIEALIDGAPTTR